MNTLREMLRTLTVRGSVYFCDTLNAPWERRFRDEKRSSFHVVRRGACRLVWSGGAELLEEGDLVLVKSGFPHSLSSIGNDPQASRPTTMLCGYCCFHATPAAPVIDALPPILMLRAAEIGPTSWLAGTIRQLSDTYLQRSGGKEVVVDRLTEILMIELIHMQVEKRSPDGYQLAMSDPQISRALRLLQSQPEVPWTIGRLAERVALSRAAFAKRFKARLGMTVFQYLTRIRIHRAQLLLRTSRESLSNIAHQVGYGSDLTFSKAFKRATGTTPGRFRKN